MTEHKQPNVSKVILVQCKKTGRWYDPKVELYRVLSSLEVIEMLVRMKNK